MTPCKECGTNLPDEARFCYHCGTPVKPADPEIATETPPQAPPELDFVKPALAGGAFLGILSTLPILSAGNTICCMWVLGGGALATFLLSKQQPRRKLTYGDGAFAGVSSGLFGAMIATLISIPIRIASAAFFQAQQDDIEKLLRNYPDIPEAMVDLAKRLASPEISTVTVLGTFISDLIIFALFAMVGGILMTVYLDRKAAAARPRGGNMNQS